MIGTQKMLKSSTSSMLPKLLQDQVLKLTVNSKVLKPPTARSLVGRMETDAPLRKNPYFPIGAEPRVQLLLAKLTSRKARMHEYGSISLG